MIEQTATVSIVISSYNNASTLRATIDSALAQSVPCEVVVVDDGSTDSSPEIIASYGGRIIAVDRPNGGQPAAVTTGFESCTGDVVIFLDSDDLVYPATAATVLDRCASGVSTWAWYVDLIDGAGEPIGGVYPGHPIDDGERAAVVRFRGPESRICPPMSGMAWSRDFLERAMPLPTTLPAWADSFLIDAAPLFGTIVAIDERLGAYRLHQASRSQGVKSLTVPNLERAAVLYRTRCDYLARFVDWPPQWAERNWRQQVVLRLLGRMQGRPRTSAHAMVRAALSVDGSWVKRAGVIGFVLAALVLPRPLAVTAMGRVLHLEWM